MDEGIMDESNMSEKVIEAFGKFVTEIDGEIVTFEDKLSAATAVALFENKEEMASRIATYCKARELTGKNEKAKTRIITDFLAFEATF